MADTEMERGEPGGERKGKKKKKRERACGGKFEKIEGKKKWLVSGVLGVAWGG
ncbi:hypothetical protein ACNKHV_19180 [Shigella flexneri]